MFRLSLIPFCLLTISHTLLDAREITYPSGYEVVLDITAPPYNADPTGVEDVGPLIEQAVFDALSQAGPAGSQAAPIVYFPNGRYRVATPVVLETETPGGPWRMLQGQSREGVVLFSDENDPDFQDPQNPVALISYFEGDWTNNAFTTLFENFTVEIAAGNPGAVGVRFHGNNVARMENVTIISLDPDSKGRIGLDLKKSISAPGIIRDVEVIGFDIGVDIANPTTGAQGWTLTHLTTRNQLEVAIQSHRKAVQVLEWTSVNTVPAFESLFRDGMLTIIGADLSTPEGTTSDSAAISAKGDFIYLRDVTSSGYAYLLDDNGTLIPEEPGPQTYKNGPVYKLWDDSDDNFLGLQIVDTPEVPWEAPELWEIVDPDAQDDDTEVLQAALRSGAKTIFLLPGLFKLSESVFVGPEVQRIASNWARFQWDRPLAGSGKAVFYWEESIHDTVIIERIAGNWWRFNEYMVHNATDADMVIRDVFWVGGGVYRNEPTGGRLFIENTHNLPGQQKLLKGNNSWIITNQQTWARQFNPEMSWPLLTVDGGRFWVSGFKFGEHQGPVVIARNQARVEMLGGYMNVTDGLPLEPEATPMIEVHDSQVSIRLIERAKEHSGPSHWNYRHEVVALEERDGETRELMSVDNEIIHRDTMARFGPGTAGAMVPHFSSVRDQDAAAFNVAPEVEVTASKAATTNFGAQLLAGASDPDKPDSKPAVHWRKLSGPGAAYFDDAGSEATMVRVSIPGTYSFVATATDEYATTDSEPLTLEFGTDPSYHTLEKQMVRLTDSSSPRDGKADSGLLTIFQQVGDFKTSLSNTEQEIRLHAEVPIRKFKDRADDIVEAKWILTTKALTNPPDIEVHRTTTWDYGIASFDDFSAESTLIETIPAASFQVDQPVEIDVTSEVKAAISEGKDGLGLQLRMAGGPNDDGSSNFVEFYGTLAATPEFDPVILIDVDPSKKPFLSDYIAELSSGTGYLSPLGTIYPLEDGWVSSVVLDQSIYLPPNQTPDAYWFYSSRLGWCYLWDNHFPVIYQLRSASWLSVDSIGYSGWAYNFNAGVWLHLKDL